MLAAGVRPANVQGLRRRRLRARLVVDIRRREGDRAPARRQAARVRKENGMDQDKAFEGYWEANRERLLWIAPGLSGQVKDFAREVWYGSANANATNNK